MIRFFGKVHGRRDFDFPRSRGAREERISNRANETCRVIITDVITRAAFVRGAGGAILSEPRGAGAGEGSPRQVSELILLFFQ